MASVWISALETLDKGWYSRLNPRWMDLVGDFAGSEAFVIDGDSLCRLILDDPLLALGKASDLSFQLVHAIWALEKLVQNFVSRRCNFGIVFFEVNRHLVLASSGDSTQFVSKSHKLARTVFKRYLTQLKGISVSRFTGLDDPKWELYKQAVKPICILYSDASFSSQGSSGLPVLSALTHRKFVYDVLASGIAIVSLDSADLRGSKIISFVYEQRRSIVWQDSLLGMWHTASEAADALDVQLGPADAINSGVNPIKSQREWAQVAVPLFLQGTPVSANQDALLYLFVVHLILLPYLALADRAQGLPRLHPALQRIMKSEFLPHVFQALEQALGTTTVSSGGDSWRADLDGRVFFALISRFASSSYGDATMEDVIGSPAAEGVKAVIDSLPNKASKSRLRFGPIRLKTALKAWAYASETIAPASIESPTLPLMPFDNAVFNRHLSSIHTHTKKCEALLGNIPASPRTASSSDSDSWDHRSPVSSPLTSPTTDRFSSTAIFKDGSHWHTNRKLLAPFQEKKAILFGDTRDASGGTPKDGDPAWLKKKREKWQQKFMASLHRHAATLTGAKGAQLQKIVIPATRRLVADVVATDAETPPANTGTKVSAPRKTTSSISGAGKNVAKQPKLSSVDRLRAQIQADRNNKTASESEIWWKQKLSQADKLSTVEQKASFLDQLSRNKRMTEGWLRIESILYRVHLELSSWIYDPDPEASQAKYAVHILHSIHSILDDQELFDGAAKLLRSLLNTLGFSQLQLPTPDPPPKSRALSFKFIKFASSKCVLYPFLLIKNPIDFQLEHCGVYMDRSMDGKPDDRVSFLPDAWQRELLDRVDRRESCLAVAPTSSGKTFISFYAMEQVLRESDDGVLVYVAPTKALVNQLTAEVAARFDKTSKSGSLWAAHTRDYRVNDPSRCQILVTVPEMLSIMLLSPVLARIWIPKLRWIILDEIHSIGQQDGGSVWEQLVLLAPCPILGLSATIGNPREFNKWLGSVQEQHGYKHNLIEHKPRYSHLRKSIYRLSSSIPEFEGLSSIDAPPSRLTFVHPMSVLDSGITILPEDLALESRDCVTLYRAMKNAAHESPEKLSQLIALEPAMFLSGTRARLVAQKDVLRYEAALKAQLTEWMTEPDVQRSAIPAIGKELAVSGLTKSEAQGDGKPGVIFGNIIHLLKDLHLRDQLPAILFNFDRHGCEVIAITILQALISAEEAWRSTSPEWAGRLAQRESWNEGAKARERATLKATKFKRDPDDPPPETSGVTGWEASFDPTDPSPQFSFAGAKSPYSKDEMERDIAGLNVTPDWAIVALRRGVAVHHQGMNRKYRALVESLFRIGFLRVVIATGTLALGINMPVRTAVFVLDSPFLTPLTFRQCAGRAGRRGLDLLGNVVFYGIPLERVHRLLTSKISPLTGNMPLTTTLSLRLCNLLHGSDGAPSAVRAIESILELPQLSVASDIGRDELLHHLRFSIDYLRHSNLLGATGQPMIMFPLAAHLYHTEPSNLALVVLLQKGVLHRICAPIDTDPYNTKRDLVALLSHLFARRSLPRVFAGADAVEKLRPPKCPSRILLPDLSPDAKEALSEHNKQILGIFKGCVQTYAIEHLRTRVADDTLPLSEDRICGKTFGNDVPYFVTDLRNFYSASKDIVGVSMFAANSGVTDASIASVGELTRTTRAGLHLSKHAIPSMDSFVLPQELPLNGYILDFFNHGQVQALTTWNQLRQGDVWFALQDFSLALSTLRTGLEHYFKSIEGAAEDDESDLDLEQIEEDSEDEDQNDGTPVSAAFPTKPKGVDDGDWNIYRAIVATKEEFGEKYKKMWA